MKKLDKEQVLYCMIEGCIKEPSYVKTFANTVVFLFPDNYHYWVSELNKHAGDPEFYNKAIKARKIEV